MAYTVQAVADGAHMVVVEIAPAGPLRRYALDDGSRLYERDGELYRHVRRCGRATSGAAVPAPMVELWGAARGLADGRWLLVEEVD